MEDRYGNRLSTTSAVARDAYVEGVDLYLSSNAGVAAAFRRATAADPDFALAHAALARELQTVSDMDGARTALQAARDIETIDAREASHINVLSLLIGGKPAAAYTALQEHLKDYPRDVLIAQPAMGVFGLIGFSGRAGREAENLAFAEKLAPHYGDDWWMQSILSFAQMEVGQFSQAERSIETSLQGNPRNAGAAHHRAHLYYETGETDTGYAYLDDWRQSYPRDALLHCHVSWHIALWDLARGDADRMWTTIDADIDPATSTSPSINILTDLAAILYRAELAGVEVSPQRWKKLSQYASATFPKPGVAFADIHAALAHAMAGQTDALDKIRSDAKGPAGDQVKLMAEAFGAITQQNWAKAIAHLTQVMADHARLGGSRAQRDLIDFTYASVLLRSGKGEEAARTLRMRRPLSSSPNVVSGLPA